MGVVTNRHTRRDSLQAAGDEPLVLLEGAPHVRSVGLDMEHFDVGLQKPRCGAVCNRFSKGVE